MASQRSFAIRSMTIGFGPTKSPKSIFHKFAAVVSRHPSYPRRASTPSSVRSAMFIAKTVPLRNKLRQERHEKNTYAKRERDPGKRKVAQPGLTCAQSGAH